ncbi:MAG: arginase family protein [Pseudomonadota bacterium]
MYDRWLFSPWFLNHYEPGLVAAAPGMADVNRPEGTLSESPKGLFPIHARIHSFVEETLSIGERPVTFTGDCLAAIPALAGVQSAGRDDPWIVWVDAHGDFNTPETSPSGALVGMPLAMMTGRGPQDYCLQLALNPIPDERIILVDVRDLDPLEEKLVAEAELKVISMEALGSLQLNGPVHLHFDPDVISAQEAPGFRFPAQGGPSAGEVCRALKLFMMLNNVTSISLGGWTPRLDTSGQTATAVRACFDAITGQSIG